MFYFQFSQFSVVVSFSIMLMFSVLAVIAFHVFMKDSTDSIPSFLGNMPTINWVYAGLGVAGAFFISWINVAVSGLVFPVNSLLYVPQFGIAAFGSQIMGESLMQLVLVAPAEEFLKISMILALLVRTKNEFIAAGTSIGIWAVFHTIIIRLQSTLRNHGLCRGDPLVFPRIQTTKIRRHLRHQGKRAHCCYGSQFFQCFSYYPVGCMMLFRV
ncbi:MAG: hypothetical protein ABIH76_08475 [Candidatus Bathyarchaeota archaeon]